MFKLNSGFRWTSSGHAENTATTLPWTQQNIDSDIENSEHQHPSAIDIPKSDGEQQLVSLLSNLLRYGVLIASAVVLFGGILYLVNYGTVPTEYDYFHGEPAQFCSPLAIVKAIFAGSGTISESVRERAIIQFGLLLLIATPVIRVIISFLSFLRMRDWAYTIITFVVLTALTYSLVGAYY
jgi:uncharacterized membrane protein